MDKSDGYVAIWRMLEKHWLSTEDRPKTQFEAWIDIIWQVQHSTKPTKVKIGNQLLVCNYGESLKALGTWASRWGWNKSAVRKFFILLASDDMIETVNETVTTRLKVCNYKIYDPKMQPKKNDIETQQNALETHETPDKNVKNGNNDKERKEKKKSNNPDGLLPARVSKKTISKTAKLTKAQEIFYRKFDNYVLESTGRRMDNSTQQKETLISIMKNRNLTIANMETILDEIIATKDEEYEWYGVNMQSFISLNGKTNKSKVWKSLYILQQAEMRSRKKITHTNGVVPDYVLKNAVTDYRVVYRIDKSLLGSDMLKHLESIGAFTPAQDAVYVDKLVREVSDKIYKTFIGSQLYEHQL